MKTDDRHATREAQEARKEEGAGERVLRHVYVFQYVFPANEQRRTVMAVNAIVFVVFSRLYHALLTFP